MEQLETSGSEKLGPLKRGRPTKKLQRAIKPILEEYYHSGKAAFKVAEETGLNRKTVNRYFRQFYRKETKKMDEEFVKKWNQRSKERKINGQ